MKYTVWRCKNFQTVRPKTMETLVLFWNIAASRIYTAGLHLTMCFFREGRRMLMCSHAHTSGDACTWAVTHAQEPEGETDSLPSGPVGRPYGAQSPDREILTWARRKSGTLRLSHPSAPSRNHIVSWYCYFSFHMNLSVFSVFKKEEDLCKIISCQEDLFVKCLFIDNS